ncbi:MAG: hypothetical protein ABFD65_11770, partial [Candidatus Polarisedimenticolia bacterium]
MARTVAARRSSRSGPPTIPQMPHTRRKTPFEAGSIPYAPSFASSSLRAGGATLETRGRGDCGEAASRPSRWCIVFDAMKRLTMV